MATKIIILLSKQMQKGFPVLDFQNTGNTKNPANDAKLTQYTGDTPTDVYLLPRMEAILHTTLTQKEKLWFLICQRLRQPSFSCRYTSGNRLGCKITTPNFVKSETNENEYSISLKNVPSKNI